MSRVGYTQTNEPALLFQSEAPINIGMHISIKEIKNNKESSISIQNNLLVAGDTLISSIKARGNFRFKECFFPPLELSFKKKDSRETIFEGSEKLKLVLPCRNQKGNDIPIVKEYICYLLYQLFNPHYFNVRLANIELFEQSGKKERTYQLVGFLIEDDKEVSRRTNTKLLGKRGVHPKVLNDTAAIRHDLFQFMISNADWSTINRHNLKILFQQPQQFYPLAYDFDMAGLVNAGYAQDKATNLGTGNNRDRVYRGVCRSPDILQFVRQEYLTRKPIVLETLNKFDESMSSYDLNDMRSFLNEFYTILGNDFQFKTIISDACKPIN